MFELFTKYLNTSFFVFERLEALHIESLYLAVQINTISHLIRMLLSHLRAMVYYFLKAKIQ